MEKNIVQELFEIEIKTQKKCSLCDTIQDGRTESLNCLSVGLPDDVFTLAGALEKVTF